MASIMETDEFGQEWYSYANAVPVGAMSKRLMVADAIKVLRADPSKRSTFVSSGDTLFTVMRVTHNGNETFDVYECRTLRHTFDYKPAGER